MEKADVKDSVDTMIMLDMEVRKKIRAELMDIVSNPQNKEEEDFAEDLLQRVEHIKARRMAEMQKYYSRMYEMQGTITTTTTTGATSSSGWSDAQSAYEQQLKGLQRRSENSSQNTSLLGSIKKTFF